MLFRLYTLAICHIPLLRDTPDTSLGCATKFQGLHTQIREDRPAKMPCGQMVTPYFFGIILPNRLILFAPVDRPNVWRPLVSREFSERGRSRDPNRALTDPLRAILPEQHCPENLSAENLDGNILKPISNADGIIPGYGGFVPHIRSNSIPGFNFKRLTRHKGETARLNRESIAYITENRFQDLPFVLKPLQAMMTCKFADNHMKKLQRRSFRSSLRQGQSILQALSFTQTIPQYCPTGA